MEGFIRLGDKGGYNLNNLDTWVWKDGALFLFFTGSQNPSMIQGKDAEILRACLIYKSTDIVKRYQTALHGGVDY